MIVHEKELVEGHNHINGIEGFWSYSKERFHKYHGINKKNYPLLKRDGISFQSSKRKCFKDID